MKYRTPPILVSIRRGFTLVEMLVVIGIIVLVLAMAVPVVNSIVGNRSFEAAYNRLSATLNHARQLAIYNHNPCGVAFYIDPLTGREDMAYVSQDTTREPVYPYYMDVIAGEETTSLPDGIAAQVISGAGGHDRYLSFGIILFDENGQLIASPFQVSSTGTLYNAAHWNMKANIASDYTSLGLALYDRAAFKAQIQPSTANPFDDSSADYYSSFNTQTAPSDKPTEDLWLDQNAQVMMLKPNDGSLLRNK